MDNAKKPPKDDVLENTVSDLKALKGSEKKRRLESFCISNDQIEFERTQIRNAKPIGGEKSITYRND